MPEWVQWVVAGLSGCTVARLAWRWSQDAALETRLTRLEVENTDIKRWLMEEIKHRDTQHEENGVRAEKMDEKLDKQDGKLDKITDKLSILGERLANIRLA